MRVLVEINQFRYWLAFLYFRPCLLDARGAGVYSVLPQFLTERSQGETEAQSEGARGRGQARGQARGTRSLGRIVGLGGHSSWVSGSPTKATRHPSSCMRGPSPTGEGTVPSLSDGRRGGGFSEAMHRRASGSLGSAPDVRQERRQGAPRAKAQIDGFALETRSEDVICAFVWIILLRTRGAT